MGLSGGIFNCGSFVDLLADAPRAGAVGGGKRELKCFVYGCRVPTYQGFARSSNSCFVNTMTSDGWPTQADFGLSGSMFSSVHCISVILIEAKDLRNARLTAPIVRAIPESLGQHDEFDGRFPRLKTEQRAQPSL